MKLVHCDRYTRIRSESAVANAYFIILGGLLGLFCYNNTFWKSLSDTYHMPQFLC
jgi:hypothetical protein